MIDLHTILAERLGIAVPIQKIFNGSIVATSCANMIKIGPVTPEITRVTTAPFWTRRQKSAYPTKYVDNYYTDLHRLFMVNICMGINKTDISFAV